MFETWYNFFIFVLGLSSSSKTFFKRNEKQYFLSHFVSQFVKDVRKDILRRNLIQTR